MNNRDILNIRCQKTKCSCRYSLQISKSIKDGQTNLIGITSNLIEENITFAHTMPNMSLIYIGFKLLEFKVKLDYLIVPVFFDDTESEIRNDFISKIIEDNLKFNPMI